MEDGNELGGVLDLKFFFRDSLSYHLGIVVNANDRIIPVQFPEELVVTGFVESNQAAFFFCGYFCLLD